jgi:hypothetical protein
VASLLLMLIATGPAAASNVQTLDAHGETAGHVIEDSAGNAYIAWSHFNGAGAAYTAEFCKVPTGGKCASPLNLALPAPAESTSSVDGAFPVFGPGAVLYVVAPRYLEHDVVLYTSTDEGASFGPGVAIESSYSSKTDPTNVFLVGSEFLTAGYNAGLGLGAFTAAGGLGHFEFASPGTGGVASADTAIDSAGDGVSAFFNLSSPPYPIEMYHSTVGPKNAESGWAGPTLVTTGYEPRLAGGSAGIYMLSQDYAGAGASYPSRVDVRKYSAGAFGSPVTLFSDTKSNLYSGGAIAQSPGGHVAVAWPMFSSSPGKMRLLVSSNGGASFSAPAVVARLGATYAIGNNPQLAINDDSSGWLTFLTNEGLQLANLETGSGPPGSNAKVGSDVVTLAGPKGCVKAGSSITGRLTVASAKRKHKVVLKIYKVVFGIDGKGFKTLVREKVRKTGKVNPHPYVASVVRSLPAGSTHSLTAQAFISEKHGKHASRTLHVSFTVCS